MDERERVMLNFMVEVYIAGRSQPLVWPWALMVDRDVEDSREVMNYAHAKFQELMGLQHRMTIVDDRYNHHIIVWKNVAAISILAPDADAIPWAANDDD